MRKLSKVFILFLTCALLLSPFAFTSAQQPQWHLHYSTGNLFDFFFDLHFVNENYGFVGGTDLYDAKLLKTTDGGNTWEEIYHPLFASEFIYSVFFIDSLQGWIGLSSNRVLMTTDGGYSWNEQTLGPTQLPVRDIYFKNHLEGWAVGGNTTPGWPKVERGFIIRTTDSGNTWQLANDDTLIYKQSICFSDSLHGIVTGWHQRVYTTNDGGNTWTLNTNLNPDYEFDDSEAVNDSTFYITGTTDYGGTPILGKSTDWGNNWSFIVWLNPNIDYFMCVDFIDEQRGWFGADYGKFIQGMAHKLFKSLILLLTTLSGPFRCWAKITVGPAEPVGGRYLSMVSPLKYFLLRI